MSVKEEAFLIIVNNLFETLKIPKYVIRLTEISIHDFTNIYELICKESLHIDPSWDDARAAQTIIDNLSRVLDVPLIHFNGDQVARRETESLCNLIEILSCLLDCVKLKAQSYSDISDLKSPSSIATKPSSTAISTTGRSESTTAVTQTTVSSTDKAVDAKGGKLASAHSSGSSLSEGTISSISHVGDDAHSVESDDRIAHKPSDQDIEAFQTSLLSKHHSLIDRIDALEDELFKDDSYKTKPKPSSLDDTLISTKSDLTVDRSLSDPAQTSSSTEYHLLPETHRTTAPVPMEKSSLLDSAQSSSTSTIYAELPDYLTFQYDRHSILDSKATQTAPKSSPYNLRSRTTSEPALHHHEPRSSTTSGYATRASELERRPRYQLRPRTRSVPLEFISDSILNSESSDFVSDLSPRPRDRTPKPIAKSSSATSRKIVRFADESPAAPKGKGVVRKVDQLTPTKEPFKRICVSQGRGRISRLVTQTRKSVDKAATTESAYRKLFSKENVRPKPKRVIRPRRAASKGFLRATSRPDPAPKRKIAIPESPTQTLVDHLFEEFPGLDLSPRSVGDLWRKHNDQLEILKRALIEVKCKPSKPGQRIAELQRRQRLLLGILRKELAAARRRDEQIERRNNEIELKCKLRDKRLQSARLRRYYDDFQTQMRAKMSKKKDKEEAVFRKLFDDCIKVQKEQLIEMQKYARDKKTAKLERYEDELASIENFYNDKFKMMAENLVEQRNGAQMRENAQKEVLRKMRRELVGKMEGEIRDFQGELLRDDDFVHFRQLDAERIKTGLRATLV